MRIRTITLAAALLVGCNQYRDSDDVTILSEKISPDGQFVASSFSCSGGGAAGYCYFNANLRRKEELLDQRDCLLGKHPTWKAFNEIELKWIDNSHLEVSYQQDHSPAYEENNAVRVESKYGVQIHYVVTNEPQSQAGK